MTPSEYRATLEDLAETARGMHNLIHVTLETIKNSETGMDTRWSDLYAMMRLVGVTIDLSNAARDREA